LISYNIIATLSLGDQQKPQLQHQPNGKTKFLIILWRRVRL